MLSEIESYLKWKESNYPRAAQMYAIHLKRFNLLCKKKLEDITIEDIVSFNNSLKSQYTQSHISYAMTVVRDFVGFYFKDIDKKGKRKCYVDPTRIRIRKAKTNPYYAVTEEEYYHLMEVMREDTFYHAQKKIMVRLLYETGLRVSELVALNIDDIINEERKALVVTKKGKEKGWIVWTEELHDIMSKFLGVRLCMNERRHLFVTERGANRPTTRTVERWIKQIVKEYGMNPEIVVHSFRHGKAHYMYNNGADVVAVSKALRHSENNPMGAFMYLRFNETQTIKVLREYLPS